jgi:hypothetical protein
LVLMGLFADSLERIGLALNVRWSKLDALGRQVVRNLHGDLRAMLACSLFADFEQRHRSLVRFVLEQEIAYARHVYNDCYVVTLMACSFMLCKLGQVEDALLISDAKACSYDAQSLIDAHLMCGAGVEATLKHLRSLGTDEANEVAQYLASCREHGDLQNLPDRLAGWEATFRVDYADALEDAAERVRRRTRNHPPR